MEDKVIALDIGRVCVNLMFDKAKEALGYPADIEPPEAFMKISQIYEHGMCSHERWLKVFHRITRRRFSDKELIDAWNLIIGDPIVGMPDTIRELTSKGFSFVYFSDTNEPHIQDFYRKFPVAHLVKGNIFSYDVGAQKPSPKMYNAFEAKYGKPCFYIDDKECNIEGARKHGWKAHQFTTNQSFREAFYQEFGV